MTENCILFLSVFLGIPAGGIAGAISLKFVENINCFFKRIAMVKNLKNELELNAKRLGDSISFIGILYCNDKEKYSEKDYDIVKIITGLKDGYYKMYMNDLALLRNDKLQKMIIEIYDFEYFIKRFEIMSIFHREAVIENKELLEWIANIETKLGKLKVSDNNAEVILSFAKEIKEQKERALIGENKLKTDKINYLLDGIKEDIQKTLNTINEANKELNMILKESIIIYWKKLLRRL